MKPRVALIGDFTEECWPSMDLVYDALLDRLVVEPRLSVEGVRPRMRRRFSADGVSHGRGFTMDRLLGRFLDYPRILKRIARADIYHIVDHSYAHLASALPKGRAIVTCHDADAFRALFDPAERRSSLFRVMAKRILRGLQAAAIVTCDSDATRKELIAHGLVEPSRAITVPLGVDPVFGAEPDQAADEEAARRLGAAPFIFHIGSTIPRKRIDVLIRAFAIVAEKDPSIRLVRAGGSFTGQQETLARSLKIRDRITVLPFLQRPLLASVYRRARAVVLTSDREGFGFPVVEALASGTPVVATDLPVLREAGGEHALYAKPGEPEDFAAKLLEVLARSERARPLIRFSWDDAARRIAALYLELASRSDV